MIVTLLGLQVSAVPLRAQAHYPPISQRVFSSGSVEIKVSGAFSMDVKVPLNTQASIGGGDMTWLQYGASGSTAPNALITFNDLGEVGINVAQGTVQGVSGIGGEKPWCTGKVDVKPKMITGDYTCVGAASHDKATGGMGKVTISLKFTAGS